jgi:hypothetical protein
VLADLPADRGVLLEDLVAFERRELAQLQPHHGLGLLLGHAVLGRGAEFAL